VVASDDERAAIAASLGLLELTALSADLTLARTTNTAVALSGKLTADLVQSCIVSLDPVPQHIDEPIEARFVQAGSREAPEEPKPGSEVRIADEEDDPPEVYSGARIDIGATVLEHFILAVDPYPRAPGAVLEQDEGGADRDSPFAGLAALNRKNQ
jgi:uncharacterized metal-binding protein YceD (DUF177 family)